jgi:endosialidase-like protein
VDGTDNTADGLLALYSNTSGTLNTACGRLALSENTIGEANTAVGASALRMNTTGIQNTAVGRLALFTNVSGNNNTAVGFQALLSSTGHDNTAVGLDALLSNTTGNGNIATGSSTLRHNTTGDLNTATGTGTLFSDTTGSTNTAEGFNVLLSNTTGNNNIAFGYNAGDNLTTGNNNIDIGNVGVAGESNTILIGGDVGAGYGSQTATYIAGINGTTMPGGTGVVVDARGRLGIKPSSERFKDEIKPMDKASEAILALKPVTFRYKKELDADGIPQFGLVAEDVEKVNPDLVVRDAQGKVYTVRYEAVNAMLLNEFFKEHRTVQEQQKEIDALRTELKDQRALIQKVNDKVELNKSAPQTVSGNP